MSIQRVWSVRLARKAGRCDYPVSLAVRLARKAGRCGYPVSLAVRLA